MGRPSLYDIELAKEICRRIAEGESLREICKTEGMPAASTVVGWTQSKTMPEVWFEGEEVEHSPSFSERYARARDDGTYALADMLREIDSDATKDVIESVEDGKTVRRVNNAQVQRAKLQCDNIKWLLSKMAPRRYGDKSALELSGPEGKPIEVTQAADAFVDKLKAATAKPPDNGA